MLRIEPAKCKMIRGCQCKTGNRIAPLYGTFFAGSRQNNEKKINQNTEMFFNGGKEFYLEKIPSFEEKFE